MLLTRANKNFFDNIMKIIDQGRPVTGIIRILFNQKTQIRPIFSPLNSNPLDLNSNSAQKYKKDLQNAVNSHLDNHF